ncbi:hypothetical protein DDB_G0286641 [Dictyostelium discoideum AX4]|uniref:Nucleolar GTP-binding protein 1 n=1 Tax=Dictyostelium discoideum TaxID=44689 RepID=Q54LG9_DICDI|nr:hypothetical protein DDB_G0286641 [Dictyostelium discoideum AX4]EAL64076.1 hypothetical protein DDB_G0286641 [Dictyostelium discoideum AX4]|eukprot:XP_637592.1 hypothetical protein DDB_G0286641 [Dictyostelium discoideum AX4]
MDIYSFKNIQIVTTSKELVDIVSLKIQNNFQTDKQNSISHIRSTYMKKVKCASQFYNEKLNQIVIDFPFLENIHPFYKDILNKECDLNKYKIELDQISIVINSIIKIKNKYLKLLKYSNSLNQFKQLEIISINRINKLILNYESSLKYLEQFRKHLLNLPSINANTPTLLIIGYPLVGKSTLTNILTIANVNVETLTSNLLFVGNTNFQNNNNNNSILQVIDTQSIFDHPLVDEIEIKSINALTHLNCCILFLIDISEQCGYSIKKQVDLFLNVQLLFSDKPSLILLNKIDIKNPNHLPENDWKLLKNLEKPINSSFGGIQLIPMSNLISDSILKVKEKAYNTLNGI